MVCCLAALLTSVIVTIPQQKDDHDLDFWLGKWIGTGKSYGPSNQVSETTCENSITRDFDGHVIHEHFKGGGLTGESWSVWVPGRNKWCQTWVDNQGGYIPLNGEKIGDTVVLTTIHLPEAKSYNRMVFKNIQKTHFDWDWESTSDGGKTWQPKWQIHYSRK
jgi:hypothetical protein